jgi:hypothetical protein
MVRVYYALAGVGVVLVLLLTTLRMTSTPLGDDRETWLEATRECQRAVRESVADARFPFEPNLSDVEDNTARLSGSMDSGSGSDIERRNYVCYMTAHAEAGAYLADSVSIWKSH